MRAARLLADHGSFEGLEGPSHGDLDALFPRGLVHPEIFDGRIGNAHCPLRRDAA